MTDTMRLTELLRVEMSKGSYARTPDDLPYMDVAERLSLIITASLAPDPDDHAMSCQSIEWGWDGPEADSGLSCNCYLAIIHETEGVPA